MAARGHNLRRRCINCSLLLAHNLRAHTLQEPGADNILNILRSWISPTELSPEDILCHECFTLIQTASHSREIPIPAIGHREVCYACGHSMINIRRTHRVSEECPERSVILRWTPLHQVRRLNKVCYPCWVAATREIARQRLLDANRNNEPLVDMAAGIQNYDVAMDDDVAIPIPPPLPEPVEEVPPRPLHISPRVHSQTYKCAVTRRSCLFPFCNNPERLLVPAALKEMALLHHNLYIPLRARICRFHLLNNDWNEVEGLSYFTGFQMDDMMRLMRNASIRQIDFSKIHEMDPHLCHYWLGMNAEQFEQLLSHIPALHQEVSSASVALSILIVKLRTGDSNERLSTLFKMSRTTLEKYMSKARKCLTEQFVPLYLGLQNMTIQDVAARNKIIPEGFFGNAQMPRETKPAITICDGTYIYVQSSSNYLYQKQTYSLHKHSNLVKPFLIVSCDGYIIECLGPYKATDNDATIMASLFQNEEGPMRSFFRPGDVFILDRGFRDVIPILEAYGYKTHMPESLLEGEHQLTTLQANRSRWVTMCRWVVEIVNGRIKRDFKLFRQEYFNRASAHLMEDLKIACALLNKFHPLIEDNPEARDFLAIARNRSNLENYVSHYVQNEHLNRRWAMFERIDVNREHLNDFPKLTLTQLRTFALGSYQLKQAASYYGEHVRNTGEYIVEVANDIIEDDMPLVLGVNNKLIRGRIRSRHVASRTYYCYLLISKNRNVANTLDAITGYYCSCLVGKRTVGCCAHIMTILWYLSWGRYNAIGAPASFLNEIFVEI